MLRSVIPLLLCAAAPAVLLAQQAELRSSDNFVISFASPALNQIYRTVTGAFAVSNETGSTVSLTAAGQMSLHNEAGSETATLQLAFGGARSDLRISTHSLRGSQPAEFAAPVDWALTTALPYQLLGLSAFAVVVAGDVTVDMITMEQLAGIYAGNITNWSELGGADQAILPLQLPADASIRAELITLVMQPANMAISSKILMMADEVSIAALVNQLPGSLSVISLDKAADSNTVAVAGACGVPVRPNAFNIISGDYPLVRPVMAAYDRAPNTALLTELFDYAMSDVAQNLLARDGFTNQQAISQSGDDKNARLSALLDASSGDGDDAVSAEMFKLLSSGERLSPTMVGGQTSGPEGAWNRAMMLGLVDLVATPALAGRALFFVGLGASENGDQDAIDVSLQAAFAVETAFRQFAADTVRQNDLTLSSYGFGSSAPATCYEGQVAGPTQTRVEIWVR